MGEGKEPIVLVCAGGNDVCRVGSGELLRRFKETGESSGCWWNSFSVQWPTKEGSG